MIALLVFFFILLAFGAGTLIFSACLKKPEKYTGYWGIADPGDMMKCNAAQLIAQQGDCPAGVEASELCLQSPGTQECSEAIKKATRQCAPAVGAALQLCSHICGHHDYFHTDSCGSAHQPSDGSDDYHGQPGWRDFCSGADCMEVWKKRGKIQPVAFAGGTTCK